LHCQNAGDKTDGTFPYDIRKEQVLGKEFDGIVEGVNTK